MSPMLTALLRAFRAYRIDGVPASGVHEVEKADVAAFGLLLEAAVTAAGGNLMRYETVALMTADTAQTDGSIAYVYRNNDDPLDPANGFYQWDDAGSAWEGAAWYGSAAAEGAAALVTAPALALISAAGDVEVANVGQAFGSKDYATNADALSDGVASLASVVAGSGGTNGTFDLAFSGGAGSGAAGVFVVAGGAVVSTEITASGRGYTSAPTVSFAASAGLTGASATAVLAQNRPAGTFWRIAVADGFEVFENVADAAVSRGVYPALSAIEDVRAAVENGDYNWDFAIADQDNNVILGVTGGRLYFGLPLDVESEDYDAGNLARSAAYKTRLITTVQRPTAKYNTKVVYGQSLARGHETWPALSRTARFGNLQLGGNVLPTTLTGADYATFGAATLQPLVAQSAYISTLYTDAEEAALPPGDAAFGEPFNHGWLNFAKFLHNQQALVENDTDRLFVTYNPSVSGTTIEQLSKVNGQDAVDRYSRFTDGLTQIHAAAGAETHVVDGILWAQGEYDYITTFDSTNATKALYKAALLTLISDMVADARTITGQTLPPAFLTYQTGASFTADEDSAATPGLHVGMAQLEAAIETDNVWMVGPIYPVTDKSGHLDANGSRWYGNQIGKVWHRVVRLGQDWSPLRPVRIRKAGLSVYIDFHVPEPPLVFDSPYVVNTATSYDAKGFRVTDDDGDVPISAVELGGQTIVEISLGRETVGDAFVWYADKTVHAGNGMLRDSDATVALDTYEYVPSRGMYVSANIAALVDKPYPLHNWCVAFHLPVDYSEIV